MSGSENPRGAPKAEGVELAPASEPGIRRAGGPPPVFAAVFREHAPFVWRCLRRLGVASGDVDDVLQEVFLVVHRRLPDYDGRASMRAWIYGICVRKASDHRKLAHKKREHLTEHVPEGASRGDGPDAALERRRALARLDAALADLDEDKRAAFVLYEIEGLGLAEIAEAVGCPLQTVYSRLGAARKHVEHALGARGGAS
jgi:RNA polymerase sigma-70 factor (ECF subfamily)